jgi:hypothetical protein
MAEVKISELPPAPSAIAGPELVPIVQGGDTVRTTVASFVGGGIGYTPVNRAGDTMTGALNFAAAATVASAATTLIGAAASNLVTVTGTTTITAFDSIAAGALRFVTFSGVLVLTHNGTSLILPGAANIATAAGDTAVFQSLGSGNWRCLAYNRASGLPLVASTGTVNGIRQTVIAGNVTQDPTTGGAANFGGTTGSTTIATSTVLVVTAANRATDRVGTITNPTWTGLSSDGTAYLYLDVAVNGTCTTGSTLSAPTYAPALSPAGFTSAGAHLFNVQEMVMYAGNGGGTDEVYRVFVGQATVASGVVSAITWYAVQGRYDSNARAIAAATAYALSHNMGIVPSNIQWRLECTAPDAGFAIGDVVTVSHSDAVGFNISAPWATALQVGVSPVAVGFRVPNKGTGAATTLTFASWNQRFVISRGW